MDSGAGKSSLVRAGLIPQFYSGALDPHPTASALKRQRIAVVMTPAGHPLERLKGALAEAAARFDLPFGEREALCDALTLSDPAKSARALRCGHPSDKTDVVLVVDQFEELLTQTPLAQREPFVDFLLAL